MRRTSAKLLNKQLSMRDSSEVWGIYMAEIQKEQTSIIPNVYPSIFASDFNERTLGTTILICAL